MIIEYEYEYEYEYDYCQALGPSLVFETTRDH